MPHSGAARELGNDTEVSVNAYLPQECQLTAITILSYKARGNTHHIFVTKSTRSKTPLYDILYFNQVLDCVNATYCHIRAVAGLR